jgi:uncharacterized protein YeaO (DUF488 family)
MALQLSTYFYGSKRKRSEGLRLGCTRYPARGVPKKEYAERNIMDAWLPTVAPSRELLAWAKANNLEDARTWKTFVTRYREEMKNTNARQTIAVLAELAKRTPISIGCYCHGEHCHRFELERLIRAAAKDGQAPA